MAARGSAAWVIAIVGVTAVIVGAILLTVTDPVAQSVFASSMWSSDIQVLSDLLTWVKALWTYWPVWILAGLGSLVWIKSRRAG